MKEEKILPIIYGITEEPSNYGVQAYAMDGQTGEIMASHFCSSEGFAKSDLGFTDGPIIDYIAGDHSNPHSTVSFHNERRRIYSTKYPDGFRLEWIGRFESKPEIVELKNKNI